MEAILPMTPDGKRLQTFFTSPIPKEYDLSVSNSPMKFSEAGFIRTQNSREDEVECCSCGVKYKGWSGESPLAVHRTLNPSCNFLNTPPDTITTENTTNPELQSRRNELENVRRQLFPMSDGPMSSILNVSDIEHPFCPKRGGYLMLFESHRLLTFEDVHSADAAMYAKAGFVYDIQSQTVVCIFCNAEFGYQSSNMLQLESRHLEKSPLCPFIRSFDVGNISRDVERKIRENVRAQFLCDLLKDKLSCSRVKYLIKHPEFEDEGKRVGTFTSWPKLLAFVFPPTVMSETGLFYTGFVDKVKCFACGIGLYDWSPEAVPAEQHAKASPECLFLTQSKGQDFIDAAQNVQLIVKADHESTISESQEQDAASSATDSGVSSASSSTAATPPPGSPLSSPGSPVLDLEAIKAATACQYTLEQIVHAITKFFVLSCGQYPNADILIGALKAADENYKQICEQKQEILIKEAKEAQYQAKEAAYQQEIQAKDTMIQATRSELQRTTFEMQWRDLEVRTELEQQFVGQIQHQNEIIQQKDQVIEYNNQALEQKDHVIEQNQQALEHKDIQLEMRAKEVEDLHRHIRSLMAELDRRQGSSGSDDEESSSSSSDLEHSSESESSDSSETATEEFPIASCKVCMVKASQIVFLPCKHLCCCDSCAARLRGKNCPICRERNLGFEKVYVI